MKKKRKRSVVFFWLTCLVILFTIVSTGCSTVGYDKKIAIPEVQEDVFVYDQDEIINEETELKLNDLLVQLEKKTTAEVVVITTQSLLDMDIEDYSYELANTLGIGKADEDNGVLLLISRNDSKVRLEIGKGLEGCLNDSKCGRILDEYFVPYREKDEYSEGTYLTIQAVASVIANEYDTTLDGIERDFNQEIIDSEIEEIKIFFLLLLILVVVFIAIAFLDAEFLDGSISSSIGSSSYYGGGGSSGGFGGGGFGGGGASR